jgi:hypothetical protein
MFSPVAFPVKLNELSDYHRPRYDGEIISKYGVPLVSRQPQNIESKNILFYHGHLV